MKLKHIFLAASLVAFAIGFKSGDSVYLGAGLPAGAILFGLFMIFSLLEKETALLDEQNRAGAGEQESVATKSFSSPQDKNLKRGYRGRSFSVPPKTERELSSTRSAQA